MTAVMVHSVELSEVVAETAAPVFDRRQRQAVVQSARERMPNPA
jgi:hypothetical protein